MEIEQIGRYRILEPIGQGAIGEVYKAFDPDLGREVAIKIITRPGRVGSAEMQERFRREVQLAAHLNHPNIISVYDVGLGREQPYLVTELLAGGTLRDYLEQGELAWDEALTLLAPICQALGYAHEAGVIHRDVKPGNIMFANDAARTIKLADFGLARRQDEDRLTESGGIVGTIAYMSPEQANGEAVDPRTDIYSFGLVLFEAIAGYNPLQGETVSRTLLNAISHEPIDLSDVEEKVPAEVLALIKGALARDRKFRYGSCKQLGQDIMACLTLSAPLPDRESTVSSDAPGGTLETVSAVQIENAPSLALPPHAEEILREMFAGYGRVSISEELGGGFSGSRVFVVKPVREDGTPELPAVVKMAPLRLIQQEWQAYQNYIREKLSGVTQITGEPVFPLGSNWGGLRYQLVGSGAIEFDSLGQAYFKSSASDLSFMLKERLFRRMGALWLFNKPTTAFHLSASYDHLLPINLTIRPGKSATEATIPVIRAGVVGAPELVPGDPVRLSGFVVTELNETDRVVTLDWPLDQERPQGSFRVRIQPVQDLESIQIGLVVDTIEGVVTSTRQEIIRSMVLETMGWNFDTEAETITLPGGHRAPNPLVRLPAILTATPTVRLANIHGDLNPENILVDPATRDVRLIDFATARNDHVLHDFLRLETGIVTHLLPLTLKANSLPPENIRQLYEQVHCATFAQPRQTSASLPHNSLNKVFEMLVALRIEALTYLFNPAEWGEYYRGLVLYLIGALKYKNLGETDKKVAFYGAASALDCLETRLRCNEEPVREALVIFNREPKDLKQSPAAPHDSASEGQLVDDKRPIRTKLVEKDRNSTGLLPWLRANWLLSLLLAALLALVLMIVYQEISPPDEPTPTIASISNLSTPEAPVTRETPTSTATHSPTNTPTITPRPAQTFASPATGAINVAILLDTSTSMQDEQRLLRALEGSEAFLNRLKDEDWVAVYEFGGELLKLSPSGPVGAIESELSQVMQGLFADGETLLYDAICQAARDLAEQDDNDVGEDRHNVILLITDGEDSGIGEITTEEDVFACLNETRERTSIQIVALAFGSNADSELLEQLVQDSQGQLFMTTPEKIWDQLTTLSIKPQPQ